MNIKKTIVAMVIASTASLFATTLSDVSTLVDQVNNTENVVAKKELMNTLEKSIKTLSEKDYNKAQELIKKDLKPIK